MLPCLDRGKNRVEFKGEVFREFRLKRGEYGLGIVALPAWLVGGDLNAGTLTPLLPNWQPVPADSPLYAIYPHQRHLPPKVRAFVDFLVKHFADGKAAAAAQ